MPTVVSVPIASTNISHGSQSPINGSSQSAWNSWPMALTIVSSRVRKPTATNQCATPTTPQRFMRVWPTNSLARVTVRWAGASVRVPAGTG